MNADLVIFDCDGTLIDSERLANRALQTCLAEEGLELPLERVVERFMGRPTAEVATEIEAELGRALPDFGARVDALCFELYDRELTPVPGVELLLERLERRAAPRCVASSSDPPYLERVLAQTGLARYFGDHVYSAVQVPRGKPAPDLFLFAAERMATRPAGCVVVEDSLPGVQAARAAGMQVFGYAGMTPADALAAAGAEVVADMAELTRRLGL